MKRIFLFSIAGLVLYFMVNVKYLRSHCEFTFADLDRECAGWKTSFSGCDHSSWFPVCDCGEGAFHSEFDMRTTDVQNERLALMFHYFQGSERSGIKQLSDHLGSIQRSLADSDMQEYREQVRRLEASIRQLTMEEKQDLRAFCNSKGIKPPAFE